MQNISPNVDFTCHRNANVRKQYEERINAKREKEFNKMNKAYIPQNDEVFSNERIIPERAHIKKVEGDGIPSEGYMRFNNKGMLSNQLGEARTGKKFIKDGRKDNMQEIINDSNKPYDAKEIPHKKNVQARQTDLKDIFENSINTVPKGYLPPSNKINRVDFEDLTKIARDNIANIQKYGKKGKDKNERGLNEIIGFH